MTQEQFADLIEERRADVYSGEGATAGATAAELVQMARQLKVHSKGQFERVINPTTGEYGLVNRLEHSSESTKIHPVFFLRVAVFEGGDAYLVEVHVRMRIDGRPVFALRPLNMDAIQRVAFSDVHGQLSDDLGIQVFVGERPPKAAQ